MEGVFSSSMYASNVQMCKRSPPKASHLLFISSLKELAIAHFRWAENGCTGRYQVITGRSTPSVRCSGVGHMSSLNLACQFLMATCNTPDALQVHTRRVRCTPDVSGAHRTHAQRVPQTCRVTGREPPDAPLSVRCSPD